MEENAQVAVEVIDEVIEKTIENAIEKGILKEKATVRHVASDTRQLHKECLKQQLMLAVHSCIASERNSKDILEKKVSIEQMNVVFPTRNAIEEIGIRFLDKLIKRGQIEAAKSLLKLQTEANLSEHGKLKEKQIEQMATRAVLEEGKINEMENKKTGNRLLDMLQQNGIPIATSIQAVKQFNNAKNMLDDSSMSQQIGKAVFEKVRGEILPSIVANIITGKNPLRLTSASNFSRSEERMATSSPRQKPFDIRRHPRNEFKTVYKKDTFKRNAFMRTILEYLIFRGCNFDSDKGIARE
ncbi:unnamed protein product [Anisakis simplex]|uniref:Osmotic stress resistance protein (inferred by orthology to a C. elegans protein) n=1 Tax=Anisakis simplex TaxID=6269 RepID=A0A0M3JZ78_ANISI|nr:unnamed protein product [Anisakis simplex]